MARKVNRVLQAIRDVAIILGSITYLPNGITLWAEEPVHVVLSGFAILFSLLSIINLILVIKNVHRRGFYFANTGLQLIPSFLVAGLIPPAGIPLFVLNILILVTLREPHRAGNPEVMEDFTAQTQKKTLQPKSKKSKQ